MAETRLHISGSDICLLCIFICHVTSTFETFLIFEADRQFLKKIEKTTNENAWMQDDDIIPYFKRDNLGNNVHFGDALKVGKTHQNG